MDTESEKIKTVLGELYVCVIKLESDAIRSKRETYRIPGELDELRGQEKAYSSVRKAILDFMEKYCPE